MAIKRFQDVTRAALEVVLSNLEAPEFAYQSFFPSKYTSTLTWESLSSDGNLSVAGDVVAHDSSVVLKSRPDVSTQTGKIPKVGLLNRVGEKQLHDLFALQASPDGLEAEIYRIIFGDVRRCYEGVHMSLEQLSMQCLSTGVAEYTDTSSGVGVNFKATYAIPGGNKSGAAVAWATSASAKPIDDLSRVVADAKAKGYPIVKILMDRATFNNLRNAASTKELYSGYLGLNAGTLTPTLDNINIVLQGEGIPPIELREETINVESKAGVITKVEAWKTGKVTFLSSQVAGNTQWTQTAEQKSGVTKGSIAVNRDIVRVTRWEEYNPHHVYTKGEAVSFPVLNNTKGTFLLNTLATNWAI